MDSFLQWLNPLWSSTLKTQNNIPHFAFASFLVVNKLFQWKFVLFVTKVKSLLLVSSVSTFRMFFCEFNFIEKFNLNIIWNRITVIRDNGVKHFDFKPIKNLFGIIVRAKNEHKSVKQRK